MFKFVVLTALLAVAAARPGYLESPLAYAATPVVSTVHSVPTSVSHQSQSVVHSYGHEVSQVVAPVVKTSYHSAPVLKTYASPIEYGYGHHESLSYAAPAVEYGHHDSLSYGAPAVEYGHHTPLTYASSYGGW